MAQIKVSNLVTGADNVDDYFTTANPPLENRKLDLSAAQINALAANNITLVPAVAGHTYIPVLVHLTARQGTTQFGGGGTLNIIWEGTSTVAVNMGTFGANFGSTASTTIETLVRPQEGRSSFATGAGLELDAGATITGNGNGSATISIFYYEFDNINF